MEKKSNLRVNTSYTFHIYIYLTIYFFVKYLWNILITHGICVLMKNMRSHSTVHVEVYLFCNKSADLIFFDHIAVSSSNCLKVRRLWNCANRVHSRRVQRRENKKKKKKTYTLREGFLEIIWCWIHIKKIWEEKDHNDTRETTLSRKLKNGRENVLKVIW